MKFIKCTRNSELYERFISEATESEQNYSKDLNLKEVFPEFIDSGSYEPNYPEKLVVKTPFVKSIFDTEFWTSLQDLSKKFNRFSRKNNSTYDPFVEKSRKDLINQMGGKDKYNDANLVAHHLDMVYRKYEESDTEVKASVIAWMTPSEHINLHNNIANYLADLINGKSNIENAQQISDELKKWVVNALISCDYYSLDSGYEVKAGAIKNVQKNLIRQFFIDNEIPKGEDLATDLINQLSTKLVDVDDKGEARTRKYDDTDIAKRNRALQTQLRKTITEHIFSVFNTSKFDDGKSDTSKYIDQKLDPFKDAIITCDPKYDPEKLILKFDDQNALQRITELNIRGFSVEFFDNQIFYFNYNENKNWFEHQFVSDGTASFYANEIYIDKSVGKNQRKITADVDYKGIDKVIEQVLRTAVQDCGGGAFNIEKRSPKGQHEIRYELKLLDFPEFEFYKSVFSNVEEKFRDQYGLRKAQHLGEDDYEVEIEHYEAEGFEDDDLAVSALYSFTPNGVEKLMSSIND